jgi:hypothetical protein
VPPERKGKEGKEKRIEISSRAKGKKGDDALDRTNNPNSAISNTTNNNNNATSDAAKAKPKNISTNKTIKTILSVVRRSIRKFIVTDDSLEDAWIYLLKSFKRFDPLEKNVVTSRDFCLAVSVLIEGIIDDLHYYYLLNIIL